MGAEAAVSDLAGGSWGRRRQESSPMALPKNFTQLPGNHHSQTTRLGAALGCRPKEHARLMYIRRPQVAAVRLGT